MSTVSSSDSMLALGQGTLPAARGGTVAASNDGHAPAPPSIVVHPYATVSVKSHVPITLELKNSIYSKWASFFKSMCGKFGLKPHIDGMLPACRTDPQWDQADCCIRTWIFGSVDDSVLDLVMDSDDQTARELWVCIEGLFRANKEPRALLLSHEFHSMQQGDTPISEFCQEMKKMADSLRDIGHGVSDSQLARDILVLKELRLKNSDSVAASTALLASTNASLSTCMSPGCRSSSAGSAPARSDQRRGGGNDGGGGKRGKGRGRQQAGQATQAGGTPQPMGQRPTGP
ncbi:uncharacterized protein LOC120694183 [Panicum virgatum]|uniref:uncharacterized protein LOC120694183 n=1 Tax=Panicum virgatum TaxID=38727 RepID=UPI0019D5794D|nr:uncharacterized protein LOC120694183 [Panicum virgatum]